MNQHSWKPGVPGSVWFKFPMYNFNNICETVYGIYGKVRYGSVWLKIEIIR
jgi:hypothetical protein